MAQRKKAAEKPQQHKFSSIKQYYKFMADKMAHARAKRWEGHEKKTLEQKREDTRERVAKWRKNQKNQK